MCVAVGGFVCVCVCDYVRQGLLLLIPSGVRTMARCGGRRVPFSCLSLCVPSISCVTDLAPTVVGRLQLRLE